jgi:hypothetical protein
MKLEIRNCEFGLQFKILNYKFGKEQFIFLIWENYWQYAVEHVIFSYCCHLLSFW